MKIKPQLITILALLVIAIYGTTNTSLLPNQTIQQAINAGGDVVIPAGVYNEALAINRAVNLRCEKPLACTLNSGTAKNIVANVSNVTVDGFRFTSSAQPYTLDFQGSAWGGETSKTAGNNNITLRNCYIEGALNVYGHTIRVENCEFNGLGKYDNGIRERFGASHDNIYTGNTIHDYTTRGFWSMQLTDNITFQGNTVYNMAGGAVDCDAAALYQTRCYIRNNTIYNVVRNTIGFGQSILFENCFNCEASGNVIYNSSSGINLVNYGPDYTSDGKEYRNVNTNTVVKNNVIYDMLEDGIIGLSSPGAIVTNNTIVRTNKRTARAYYGSIAPVLLQGATGFPSTNWTIRNNIVSQPVQASVYLAGGSFVIDGNFYDTSRFYSGGSKSLTQWRALGYDANSVIGNPLFVGSTDFHLQANSPACGAGAYACGIDSPTPTKTATVTFTPTSTRTASPTSTRTATFTQTYTPTLTATPSATQTQVPLCVLITWPKGLNMRPEDTMGNIPYTGINGSLAVNISQGALLPVVAITENNEGRWAWLNDRIAFAMLLHVAGGADKVYAVEAACR